MSAPMQVFRQARLAQLPKLNAQRRFLNMQPTRRAMRPVPKEEHSAHTISQRIRTLKKIPPELIPLGVVLGYADLQQPPLSTANQTLRLSRQGSAGD
ncbi:hypothetical protein FKW77_002882 [Venturia effusa]|uniref:Uncharacterized protein n=1 Tax=Venturia effusa TaxID=50376 RepID=A0A517LDG2_9PEZI|nr:hypothetical protein FKW77_002882 [Venturia effusa]